MAIVLITVAPMLTEYSMATIEDLVTIVLATVVTTIVSRWEAAAIILVRIVAME